MGKRERGDGRGDIRTGTDSEEGGTGRTFLGPAPVRRRPAVTPPAPAPLDRRHVSRPGHEARNLNGHCSSSNSVPFLTFVIVRCASDWLMTCLQFEFELNSRVEQSLPTSCDRREGSSSEITVNLGFMK